MLANYNHTRAAILCFGGWGLQAAFHLLPRLQAAQEQRAALGAVGPDLNEVTQFGIVTPESLLTAGSQAQFNLYCPLDDADLPPFFIEQAMANLVIDSDSLAGLTQSERRAMALGNAVRSFLRPITFDGQPLTGPATGMSLTDVPAQGSPAFAKRSDLFAAALENGALAARLLEMHLVDPVRNDNLAPDDPFVQTTLYVVAPLYEPLAAALIWPTVAGLMARVGRRHISQVVALLGTGSYAADLTRTQEDAVTYTGLRELEVLAGLRTMDHGVLDAWQRRIAARNPVFADMVGEQLFDFVYLLDREKSNQSLADDSHELAVLAGNALEAMIVGGGNLLIQEQLGVGIRPGDNRPYSLIGATGDYVPVQQLLHTVNRQEESRLVREWILRSTPTPSANPLVRQSGPALVSLEKLGLTQAAALEQLTARTPGLFAEAAPDADPAVTVDALRVPSAYIMPPEMARMMRRATPAAWPDAFAAHQQILQEQIELTTGNTAILETWGLPNQSPNQGRWRRDDPTDERMLPQTINAMHEQIVELVMAAPSGLANAQRQVNQWLNEVERTRRQLSPRISQAAQHLTEMQHQAAHQEWTAAYLRAAGRTPRLLSAIGRALLAGGLVALLAYIYLLWVGRPWSWSEDGQSLFGFVAGTLAAALAVYRVRRGRAQRLRDDRLAVAQAELTARVQQNARAGLLQLYDQVHQLLTDWATMLDEARTELQALTSPPSFPATFAVSAGKHLYAAHISEPLIDYSKNFLRNRLDTEGMRSEERLDTLWGRPEWRGAIGRILRRAPGRPQWPGQPSQAQSLAELIRQTVRKSVAPVSLEPASTPRAVLIQELAQRFTVEHLLWRNNVDDAVLARQLQALGNGGDVGTASIVPSGAYTSAVRRYLENAWNRAKPTANYDVSDRLAVYGITVDFIAGAGTGDSDLARLVASELNTSLLPTQNPFNVLVIRTVHGLGLDDLDSMRRYRAELASLTDDERRRLVLMEPEGINSHVV